MNVSTMSFFRGRGRLVAGRRGLTEGVASLVQGSLGRGRAGGICHADCDRSFQSLQPWPRQDACNRSPNGKPGPTHSPRRDQTPVGALNASNPQHEALDSAEIR
jgi:hypothetical protein